MNNHVIPRDILEKLKEAIKSKPVSHKLDESKDNKSDRSMNKIGG